MAPCSTGGAESPPFFAICLVVGNVFENLPFGSYYFTELMGPKLFVVPSLLGVAYLGMAYLSWTLAHLILGCPRGPLVGLRVITLPLIASCIMVAWDFSRDPIWSTILHAWIWLRGGPYFGVPVSNFWGWFLTVYVSYQLFALYLRRGSTNLAPLPSLLLATGSSLLRSVRSRKHPPCHPINWPVRGF